MTKTKKSAVSTLLVLLALALCLAFHAAPAHADGYTLNAITIRKPKTPPRDPPTPSRLWRNSMTRPRRPTPRSRASKQAGDCLFGQPPVLYSE